MTTSCPGGDKAANLNFSARLRRAQQRTADSRSYSPPTHPKFTPAMIWEVEIVTKTRYDGFWRNIIFLKILFFWRGGGTRTLGRDAVLARFALNYFCTKRRQNYNVIRWISLGIRWRLFTDIRHALVKCIEFHYKFKFLLAVFTLW